MIRKLHIGTKLFSTFLIIAVFGVGAAAVNIVGERNESYYDALVAQKSGIVESLLEMKSVANEVDKEVGTFQFLGEHATESEASLAAEKKNKLLAHLENLDKWVSEYKRDIDLHDAEDASFIQKVENAKEKIIDSSLAYLALKEKNAAGSDVQYQARLLDNAIAGLKQTIETAIIKERAEAREAGEEAEVVTARAITFGIIASVVSVVIALFFGFFLTRLIAEPIRELRNAAARIASGDFSHPITVRSEDEVGELATAFNEMGAKIIVSRSALQAQVQETQGKAAALADQIAETEKSKTAILNLLEDIDKEKQKAEGMVVERTKELSEEKARLLASIHSLSFGFVLADAEDRIVIKNPRLQTILEFKAEPHTIHDIAELLKAGDSKVNIDIAGSCKRCMELKQPIEFKEVPYGKKFLRIICAPILAEKDTIGYIFLVEDITEAKVMERSRDEFFAVASHELRTPLTAIRGNADMILQMYADKIPDKDMKEMLVDINSSSVRLIDIVNDFLEVSRLEQGKIEIKKETFDVSEIISKVVRDLKEMITKKGLALTFTPPPTPLPQVLADKNRVEQVLVNLVGNAAKFSKEGGIAIDVVPVEKFLKVRVTDTGTGISEQNQALLFRKFQQAGEQMLARDVSQSTGLGLYISKLIMSTMGGEIGLEKSELGKGSTFAFTIPIHS